MFPSTTNKQYTNFIQHPIPFRNIILFLKVHSLMYISKSLMYVTIDIVQFYTHLQTYMATCRVHNNTRGKIYMLCGRRRHRRFPTILHIIIFRTTYIYLHIPQKAKPFHTPHFILSQRAIHHFTNYNTKHHSHILFHILCTIKSTLNSYHKYFAFVSNHVTDRSAILFYTTLAASG